MPAFKANMKLSITARFLTCRTQTFLVSVRADAAFSTAGARHWGGVPTGGVMDNEKYMVKCLRNQRKETFVLAFSRLAQGRPMRTNLYETEQELRDELRSMGLADARIEGLIQQARQTAAD
jgi:hypothetical protein